MAQQHLKFNDYQPPDVDEDGYQVAFAVTSSENSGRTQRGKMINTVLFTVEAYNLKWTNIKAADVSKIIENIRGSSFSFYHFNVVKSRWETGKFYVANINSPVYRLNEGNEVCSELSFQVTGINPI